MRKNSRVKINLATHPLRNKRLFFMLIGVLGTALLVLLLLGGRVYVKYALLDNSIDASVSEKDQSLRRIQQEVNRFTLQISQAEKVNMKKVDLINSLIFKKVFSWIDFLSALERALPESCYIISLAPSQEEGSKMLVRLKVASPGLSKHMLFLKRLVELGFENVRLESDTRNEKGQMVWDLTVTYDEHL